MARAPEKLVGPICPRMPRSIIPVSAVQRNPRAWLKALILTPTTWPRSFMAVGWAGPATSRATATEIKSFVTLSPRSVTGAFPASQRATETTPSNCEECDTDDQDECRQPVTYDYRIDERSEAHPHVDIIADHRRCQGIAARETKPPWYKREQGASDNQSVDRKQYGPQYFMAVVD